MKRIQAKIHKIGTYEIDKISLSCFDDKRYVLDDGIYTLAYFHKDSITSCKKKRKILWWLKNLMMIERHCDNWKTLWWLKNVVIIKKYCDDWKILWWLENIVMIGWIQ